MLPLVPPSHKGSDQVHGECEVCEDSDFSLFMPYSFFFFFFYFIMFIMRALLVLTIVCSSPAFATPLWRAECLGQENGVWENWVVYIFQQGRKHTFFILLLQTCVPHRWWEQEAHTWRPGRQGVWAGASFSCCSRGNSAWCSELVQMGPKAALLLSRNMASGMWILCSSASQT